MSAFQITWILKGVVQRGTGARIASLRPPLAGPTGTPNDSLDTWSGRSAPGLAVGAAVGGGRDEAVVGVGVANEQSGRATVRK